MCVIALLAFLRHQVWLVSKQSSPWSESCTRLTRSSTKKLFLLGHSACRRRAFSKHLLKTVRMINNNKDGCTITSCREMGCPAWSWEAEIQDCDLRPPKYMWTSLQPVGIKRHILWRLEIYLDWRSVGVDRLDQASQPPYSKDSEWHIGTYGWTWRC